MGRYTGPVEKQMRRLIDRARRSHETTAMPVNGQPAIERYARR